MIGAPLALGVANARTGETNIREHSYRKDPVANNSDFFEGLTKRRLNRTAEILLLNPSSGKGHLIRMGENGGGALEQEDFGTIEGFSRKECKD